MIEFFNTQVDNFSQLHPGYAGPLKDGEAMAKASVVFDAGKFSWDRADFQRVAKSERYDLTDALYMTATYRPFYRRHVNAGKKLNSMVYQLPKVYPDAGTENLTICVTGAGARVPFSVLATDRMTDLELFINPVFCFPQYIYNEPNTGPESATGLFGSHETFGAAQNPGSRRHNVTDEALDLYRTLDSKVERDDIFFYVYGILHSPDYRARFAADLKKSLPRIPKVDTAMEFWAFSEAGRNLAQLHTEYEDIAPWPELDITYGLGFDSNATDAYSVAKMRYPKVSKPDDPDGRKIDDKTTIVFNPHITISGIPERAHEYRLGSRSAIDWILESYRTKTHKASGIVNNPNDWAIEHNDPTYILDLVGRVVTVSMRTLDTIDSLPTLTL